MINKKQNGNAMIYVLIALALFGALTLALSSQNEQADGQDLSDEQAEFYATELIEYAASTKNVIDQMIATGTDIDELDFVNPTSAAFDTPPHIHKLYHPQGGGLNYREKFNPNIENFVSAPYYSGWYIIKNTNVEWTPTTSSDVILSAIRIKESVCAAINKKITGSENISQMLTTDGNFDILFELGTSDFDASLCPACEGYPMLCVRNQGGLNWGLYSISAAR